MRACAFTTPNRNCAFKTPASKCYSRVDGAFFYARFLAPFQQGLFFAKDLYSFVSEIGLRENKAGRHVASDAIINQMSWQIQSPRPFGYGVLDASMINDGVVRFIVSLLKISRPTAICRPPLLSTLVALTARITAVVVTAVERVLWSGFVSNIIKKLLEIVFPSRTHSDAAAAIPVECSILFVEASCPHVEPCSVNRVSLVAPAHAVSGVPSGQLFSRDTAARLGFSPPQLLHAKRACGAAGALAKKPTLAFSILVDSWVKLFENDQPSKSLANQVKLLSHSFAPYQRWRVGPAAPTAGPPSYHATPQKRRNPPNSHTLGWPPFTHAEGSAFA